MSITNPEAYAASQPDWKMLDGCFSGKIRPSDIDGVVERKGKFLWFEWKTTGAEIPVGQWRMLIALQDPRKHVVLIVWGVAPDGPISALQRVGVDAEPVAADLDSLRSWVENWYEWADGRRT